MAHDQRFCLTCGVRRGPLPVLVMLLLRRLRGAEPLPLRSAPAAARSAPLGWALPGPRAAAVGVMAMLALGVSIGAFVSPTIAGFISHAPLIVVSSSNHAGASGSAVIDDNSSSAMTSGPRTRTVIITTPAPASSQPTSSAAPGATPLPPAPAPISAGTPGPSGGFLGLPPVKHVFLILLGQQGYSQTFGAATDPYLSRKLPRQGRLIENYYAVADAELANEIALISGQGPTPQTQHDCPQFTPVIPGSAGREGQTLGNGCVYPATTQTVADQLATSGHPWKAYVEGMAIAGQPQDSSCRHPRVGTADLNQTPRPGDSYLTWRNPFVYFTSLIGGPTCQTSDVDLSRLKADLSVADSAPALAYIVPSACDDGRQAPCTPGAPAGPRASDAFLKRVVPMIKASAAYRDNGLVAITFDQAPQSGPNADASACCTTPAYPNLPSQYSSSPPTGGSTTSTQPTTTTLPAGTGLTTQGTGPTTPTGGGGRVGLLLISPYVKTASTDLVGYYNHFSLLATIENLFGLDKLGYAADPALPVFDAATFSRHP